MTFLELAVYFDFIEQTPSRNTMTEKMAELFAQTKADEIDQVVYMLQGTVCPPYVKADFGLGEKMIIKAAIQALGLDEAVFMSHVKQSGDIGKTTEHFKKDATGNLSVKDVFEKLVLITQTNGEGSQEKKQTILAELIQNLDPLSCRFVVRIPAQTLRLGFSDMTILDSLSWMLTGTKKDRKAIEKAYLVRPDLGYIAQMVKKHGLAGVAAVEPVVGTPILMMRAQRLPTPESIFEKLGTAVIEPKYDGFRLQIHVQTKAGKKDVQLFSRGLENVTFMYPDVVAGVIAELKADSAIMEGEAIGFDEYSGTFLPFQETVSRKRKHDISEKALEVPLKLFVFELMYLDGVSMLQVPLEKRVAKLRNVIKPTGDIFKDTLLLAEEKVMNSVEDVNNAFEESIGKGLEGIMVKKIDGLYEPGARGWNWIKYKRSYSSKIDDTIDCLVMGFDKGKGKRAGFGIGAFLVGVYDATEDVFKTVAKIGTGLSDSEWRTLFENCTALAVDHKPALYDVDPLMGVDAWVRPQIVVEIKADEITRSPSHTAGRVMKASKNGKALDVDVAGYALRFPRLKHFRTDKKPEDCTSVMEVAAIFNSQR